MRFEVRLSRRAAKELDSLEPSVRSRIILRLEELEGNPFPSDRVKVKGWEDTYRLRVGDYRVLYEVMTEEGLVLVEKIDHRKKVYEKY